jgi:hypothetical protein
VPFTPSGALGRGIVPGLGQFYTKRPVLGTVALAAAAGGVALALQQKDERRAVRRSFVDINGILRFYDDTVDVRVYPNRVAGLAVAGGVTALAAVEAYVYARRAQSSALGGGVRRSASLRVLPLPSLTPGGTGVAVDLRLPFPRRGGR